MVRMRKNGTMARIPPKGYVLLLFCVFLQASSSFRSLSVNGARFGGDGASEAEGSASELLQNVQNVAVASSGAPQCGQWRA